MTAASTYQRAGRRTPHISQLSLPMQKAGEVIAAHYPHAAVMHVVDHVVSLFFCDIAKCVPQQISLSFQRLIKKICRLYNVICCGVVHAVYAIFMEISAMMNGGKTICLLCGAGSCFASFFYAMLCDLCCKAVILAMVHSPQVRPEPKNPRLSACEIYYLLRVTYPALKLLQECDANRLIVDNIKSLVRPTTSALEMDNESLCNAWSCIDSDEESEEEKSVPSSHVKEILGR
ncbi:hypothetical protein ACHAWF_002926 [Thalassiosira exigua]